MPEYGTVMPTSMRLIDLKRESIWAWFTMAGLLFHAVLERDALGVVLLKPDFSGFDRGKDLDVVFIADLLGGVHVHEDGNSSRSRVSVVL